VRLEVALLESAAVTQSSRSRINLIGAKTPGLNMRKDKNIAMRVLSLSRYSDILDGLLRPVPVFASASWLKS
jgi:hypothetical protein